MTDSMKFGPEWLRNMSAEPSVVSNNVSASVGSSLTLHTVGTPAPVGAGNSLTSHTPSRNLFPEYRYGREEMLSLFDRNCLLPQILPSFKKLFVDKVQYPLALTPSSEEEINSHSPLGSSARPAWLQRPSGGFGIASRGSGRGGGTVDRGRLRGKSTYHPIYQRPNAIYDESGLATVSIKSERNWNERNGTGDSTAVGAASSVGGGASSGCVLDWNGTPSSSPRKEFSSHNRNLENWRRNRNEDGSGDGPAPGNLTGIEVSGWRSGAGTHRWGRSTSWRDEESVQGGNLDGTSNIQAHLQRSTSAIGTVAPERSKGIGTSSLPGVNRGINSKWSGNNINPGSHADGDDSLPEWAVENPSEMGGTFDSSGAFHGETAETKFKLNISAQEPSEVGGANEKSEVDCGKEKEPVKEAESELERENLESDGTVVNNDVNKADDSSVISQLQSTPSHKQAVVHSDISERFKEVANEVEKLIMDDDDGGRLVDGIVAETTTNTHRFEIPNQSISMNDATVIQQQQRQQHGMSQQHTESAIPDRMSLPFSDQLAMEQHHQQQLQQQQHLSVLPGHMISANPNELWFYRDPQSNVQGPFSAIEMTEWYRAGYFNENLFVRRFSDSRFRPLGELIKLCHGNMPFTHCHLLPTPMDLDNLQIALTSRAKPPALNPLNPIPIAEQQQIRPAGVDEQLRANVTAAADSLSAAVKGQMNTHPHITDTSHMLTMRFQMLQDQYLQRQEYLILSELSKNECFQRLDAAQREAIVRSKVQLLVLPEYLSSFSGLSNSLAALNPIAGNQLYDIIAQQAKKDQHQPQPIFSDQQQRSAGVFVDANDFIVNAQMMHQQCQEQAQGLSKPGSGSGQGSDQVIPEVNKVSDIPGNEIDLLNEYNLRMLLRGTSATVNQQQQVGSQLLVGQNLMMPMWPQQPQQSLQSEPWSSIPNAKVTLWDVATLEEEQNQQILLQQQQTTKSSSIEKSHLHFEATPPTQGIIEEQQQTRNSQQSQTLLNQVQDSHPKDQMPQKPQEPIQTIVKLPNKQAPLHASSQKLQGKQPELKIVGDDEQRRRECVEEKRRLKEERKRQQQEEEKRRKLIAEEEKNRQMQEEKERQQQIQAQRRKALLGNVPAIITESVISTVGTVAPVGGTNNKGRAHATSIAPWSLQSVSVNNPAPGLAEIQKAERRERRADQQRQQEQLDKQMRATAAAAAEANDALLKWQASAVPAPVMSLADIQAEEAKRLANDLLEQQRRREHEHHQQAAPPVGFNLSSGGLTNIWGNANKAWSSGSTVTSSVQAVTGSSLWNDPVPSSGGATTAASVLAAGLSPATTSGFNNNNNNKQPSQTKSSSVILSSPRNLQKSLTLPAMQSVTVSKNPKSSVQSDRSKVALNKATSKMTTGGGDDKKSVAKNHQQLSSDTPTNSKISEYANEFTTWCMKSLDNMSAKVDVPTFVAFLQDLEAPYEVKDYVRIYLGEGKESSDFAKQFLERRSKYKNLQRAQNAHNDDMCKPAPAITPSSNDNGDSKNKQKKIKKNKMTKMDARILGFSVTAAEGRINVGVRDYAEGP